MAINGKAMSFAQKARKNKKNQKKMVDRHQTFAVGMSEDEPTGESISLKDREVVTIRKNLDENSKKWGAEDLGVKFFAKAKKWAVGLDGPVGESSRLRDADVVTMADPSKITMDPKSDVHGSTPLTVKYLAKGSKKMNLKGHKFAEGLNGPIGESSQLRDADVVTMVDPKKITMDPKSNEHGAVPLTVNYNLKKARKINLNGEDSFTAQKRKFKNLAQKVIKVGGDAATEEAKVDFELAGPKGPGMPNLTGTVQGEKEWQGWAQDHVDWLDN
jgi:hypothetical protein